jgi:DNA-binding CsgD family transcriptional regulator
VFRVRYATVCQVRRAYRRQVAIRTAEARSRERIDRLCASANDATQLRVRVLEVIRGVVEFGAYVWLLTDPETTVGSAPLADIPCLPELARTIRLKYLTDVNRWTTLGAGDVSAGTLQMSTGGDPGQSPLWSGVLSRYRVVDVASAVFGNPFGLWGFLDLWRTSQPAFSQSDVAFLADIAQPLATALQRCQAHTLAAPATAVGRELGPIVFLLDDQLNIVSRTAASESWLRLLLPASADAAPVPASVYNVAAQLLAIEHGVDRHQAMARVHLCGGFWATLRAARLDGSPTSQGCSIAVTMEETPPLDRLEIFSRAYALSTREHELMKLLAAGADTRSLARKMFLAEHTVQDHLKSIFGKTSAHSRQALLARAVGIRGRPAPTG